jgi:hypothetical protein
MKQQHNHEALPDISNQTSVLLCNGTGVYTVATGTNENREQNANQRDSCVSKGNLLDLAMASLPLVILYRNGSAVSLSLARWPKCPTSCAARE